MPSQHLGAPSCTRTHAHAASRSESPSQSIDDSQGWFKMNWTLSSKIGSRFTNKARATSDEEDGSGGKGIGGTNALQGSSFKGTLIAILLNDPDLILKGTDASGKFDPKMDCEVTVFVRQLKSATLKNKMLSYKCHTQTARVLGLNSVDSKDVTVSILFCDEYEKL